MHIVISFFRVLDQTISISTTLVQAMRRILIMILYISSFNDVIAVSSPPSNCQRLTTINYHYSSPYHLPDMDADKDSAGITFNFKVRAVSDGHIRLSSNSDAKQSPVTVEIIVGAGGNTFSAVRRKPKKTFLDYSVNTYHVLSKEEFRFFTLTLNERNLTLYANNSNVPLLFYDDDSVIDMKYISFGAWNNVAVEWSFGCKGAEVPEPPITDPFLRLKRNFMNVNRFRPPVLGNSSLTVSIAVDIVHVHLDAKTSQLTLRTNFEQKWTDQIVHWNPEEFGNITQLKSNMRLVWVPTLQLLNVPWIERWSYQNHKQTQLWFNDDGTAKYRFYGDVLTWCEVDVTNWPSDEHVCEVHLGLSPGQENVGLELTNTRLQLDTAASEWEILSITSSTVTDVGDTPPQSFRLRITLKRNSGSYFTLFVVPLFMAFSMLIVSFVVAPQHNKTRLTLVSASVVILHLLLFVEHSLLPALPQSSPRIMKTTGCLLIVAMLQLTFHCFNVHIANLEIPPPQIVKTAAKKPWMKHLNLVTYEMFLSDDIQDGATGQTESLDNDSELVTTGSPEQPAGANTNKQYWALISRCLDMFTFTLSFLILPFILTPI